MSLKRKHPPTRDFQPIGSQESNVLGSEQKLIPFLGLLLAALIVWSAPSVGLAAKSYPSAPVGDFNLDGIPDLLVTDHETGELLVRSGGDATPSLEERTGIVVEASRTVHGVADFNWDGSPDLLLLDQSTGKAVVWYLKNGSVVRQETVGRPEGAYELAGVGDFNRDGSPDLLWSNAATGEAIAWYMDGATRLKAESVATLLPPWRILGVCDYNEDGAPDILYANPSTGEATVCYMKGVSRLDEHRIAGRSPPCIIPVDGEFDGQWVVGVVWQYVASLSGSAPISPEESSPCVVLSHRCIRAPPIVLHHA